MLNTPTNIVKLAVIICIQVMELLKFTWHILKLKDVCRTQYICDVFYYLHL